jgi:hypothetical protein
MSHDAAHRTSKPLSMDARELMSRAERDQESVYNWSLTNRNGRLVVCDDAVQRARSTSLLITVNWPKTSNASVTGVLWVTNSTWNMLAHPIPLIGEPKRAGGCLWRFTCPNSHRLVQTLYLDREAEQFVSREAVGRPRRQASSARIVRHVKALMDLENLAGGIDNNLSPIAKPKHMSQEIFETLEHVLASQFVCLHLAVCNMPEPSFGDDGNSIIIPSPSKRRRK